MGEAKLLVMAVLGFGVLVRLLTGKEKKHARRSGSSPRKAAPSGVRADVAAALRNQGYSKKEAAAMAARARGSSFDAMFRDALRK